LLGFFTDRSQVAIDRVGVHGPRIVALGKIDQKRYEILEVGVVQRVGLAEIAAGIVVPTTMRQADGKHLTLEGYRVVVERLLDPVTRALAQ
jgi:hypothetical protein